MRKKEKKIHVVMKSLEEGTTISEAAKKFNVSRATIYAWKEEMKAIAEKEKETVERENKLKAVPEKVLNEKDALLKTVGELRKEIVDKQFKIDMLLSLLTLVFGENDTTLNKFKDVKNDSDNILWNS